MLNFALLLTGRIFPALILSVCATTAVSQSVNFTRPEPQVSGGKDHAERFDDIYNNIWGDLMYTDLDRALKDGERLLRMAEVSNNKQDLYDAYNTLGTIAYYTGDYEKSIRFYTRCLEYHPFLRDSLALTDVLNNLGSVYKEQGRYALAMDYFSRNLDVCLARNDTLGTAATYNGIGIIYSEQKNYHKAETYFQKSLIFYNKANDTIGIGLALANLGLVYYEMKQFEKARDFYNRSLDQCFHANDVQGIITALNNLGHISIKENRLSEARNYFIRAKNHNEKLGDMKSVIHSLNNLGLLNMALGDSAQAAGNNTASQQYYKEGIRFCEQAFQKADSIGTLIESLNATNYLYQLYKLTGNLPMALFYFEKNVVLSDSSTNILTQQRIIELEYEHKYKRQALLDSTQRENERKLDAIRAQDRLRQVRTNWYMIVGGVLFLVIIAFFMARLKYLKLTAERKDLLQRITQLKTEDIVKRNATDVLTESPKLNRAKIEAAVDGKLNQSDWFILETLFDEPGITNKELADRVSLSLGGTRSSLQKMYRVFDVKTSRNQRLALVVRVSEISNDQP